MTKIDEDECELDNYTQLSEATGELERMREQYCRRLQDEIDKATAKASTDFCETAFAQRTSLVIGSLQAKVIIIKNRIAREEYGERHSCS